MYRLFAARSLQARQPRFVFTELAREELVVHLAGRPTSVAADGSISGREASRPTHRITLVNRVVARRDSHPAAARDDRERASHTQLKLTLEVHAR